MKIRITLEAEIPDGATDEEITAWVKWETGNIAEIHTSNPLVNYELKGQGETEWVRWERV